MGTPTPRLDPDGPLELVAARTLFADAPPGRRNGGERRPHRVERAAPHVLLARGRRGAAQPGRADGHPLGRRRRDVVRPARRSTPTRAGSAWRWAGSRAIADDNVKLLLGRILIDLSLGGTEPMTGWYVASATTRDGGETWSEPSPEIRLVPRMDRAVRREQPASARRRPAAVGRHGHPGPGHRLACRRQRQRSRRGDRFEPPTIIAQADGRDYSDIDVVRLDDGRFLAVVREHQTRQSVWSTSERRGREPGRRSARRRSWARTSSSSGCGPGAIVCAYRDEDPERRGVSLSVTDDGGESWTSARPAVRGRRRRAPRAGQRVRLPGPRDARRRARSARSSTPTRRPTASSSTGSACATGLLSGRTAVGDQIGTEQSTSRSASRYGRRPSSTSLGAMEHAADDRPAPARAWRGRSGGRPRNRAGRPASVVEAQDA